MSLKETIPVLKQTFSEWIEDQAPTLGAALAYYTVFSLAPLLVISISIAGLVFGKEAAQGQIFDQLRGLLGDESGRAMRLRTPDTVELGWTQRGENEPEVGAWKEGLRGGEFLAEINEHCIVGRRAQAMEPHG